MDLIGHMRRAMAFSRATFGPGERTKGICEHISKEIEELQNAPDFGLRSREWVDVTILGLDGLWRALAAEGFSHDTIPEKVAELIQAKQSANEQRTWPDWRGRSQDKAIEHVRSKAELAEK